MSSNNVFPSTYLFAGTGPANRGRKREYVDAIVQAWGTRVVECPQIKSMLRTEDELKAVQKVAGVFPNWMNASVALNQARAARLFAHGSGLRTHTILSEADCYAACESENLPNQGQTAKTMIDNEMFFNSANLLFSTEA